MDPEFDLIHPPPELEEGVIMDVVEDKPREDDDDESTRMPDWLR